MGPGPGVIKEMAKALVSPDCAKRCLACGAEEDHERVEAFTEVLPGNGPPCEISIRCDRCDSIKGYWAYGHWNPDYRQEELRRESVRYRVILYLTDNIRRIKCLTRKFRTWMAR